MAPVDTTSSDGCDEVRPVTRRRLLGLAGTAGLAAAIAACQAPSASRHLSSSTSTSPAPAIPSPLASTVLPPSPAPLAMPPVTPTSRVLLCRAAWKANEPRPGGIPNVPIRMTIHHTATMLSDNSEAPARLRQHQHYHQDVKGWIDIAYHISVDRNGNLYELRNPEIVGDTATNYDPTGHFLVVCEGNFDEEEVTEEQLNGAALAFAWAATKYQIPTETLRGHLDVSGDTACPGASLYAHVRSGDLQRRVEQLLDAAPVELWPACGSEGDGIVAGIEAGF